MPKENETRSRILLISAELFAEQGYEGTSTRNIAKRVGITQPGLYRHFASKAEIFRTLGEIIITPWCEAVNEVKSSGCGPAQGTVELLKRICVSITESPYKPAFLLTEPAMTAEEFQHLRDRYEIVTKAFRSLVKDGVKQGELRAIDPTISAHMFMSLTDVLIFPVRGSEKSKIEEVLAIVAYGIIKDPELAERVLEAV